MTAGGHSIAYLDKLTTRTADLATSKILWNSMASTKGSTFAGADIKNFHLRTPLDRYKYMQMDFKKSPLHIVKQYDLNAKAKGGILYLEIRRKIYELLQAGILANK